MWVTIDHWGSQGYVVPYFRNGVRVTLDRWGSQGGVMSCFRTHREPIHGGSSATSCRSRS